MNFLTKKQKKIFKDLIIYKESEEVINPYSGVKCVLKPDQLALYDYIKGCELLGLPELSEALTLFQYNWPEEYYKLLD